ncbi:hypothetical protein [Paraburkholderia heleia]|uniref:hypothetical protein n=1 Tax=Paraburkholderia heleia TaxID=634127 RepID=UPI0031D0F0FF
MQPHVVTEQAITSALTFGSKSIDVIEAAFASLANGSEVLMPPVLQINVDAVHGQTCVKSAYTVGEPHFAVKLASTYHDNQQLGLPNSSGLMLVCSSQIGRVAAILLDNGYLTALRTQAAGAVATRYLSRVDSHFAAMMARACLAMMAESVSELVAPKTGGSLSCNTVFSVRFLSPRVNVLCRGFPRGVNVCSGPEVSRAHRCRPRRKAGA